MAAGRRIRILATGGALSVVTFVAAWTTLHDTTPSVAYLWGDTDGGACVRHDPPAAYDDGDACSPDEAWHAAIAGDTVVLQPGDYGNQKFTERDEAMTAPGVNFYVNGAHFDTLNIGCEIQSNGCLPVHTDHVDYLNLIGTRGSWGAQFLYFAMSTHIVVDGITVDRNWAPGKAVFWAGSTDHTTIRNCRINRNSDAPLMEALFVTEDETPNSNITFEDCDIGLMRRSPEVHNECFLAPATPGLTITRTRWHGCNVMNINIGAYGPMVDTVQSGYRWTNNVFESPTNYTESDKTYFPWFQGCNAPNYTELPDAVWAYNVFESGMYGCGGFTGLTMRGNVGTIGNSGCAPGVVWEYNVLNVACGDTDTAVPDIMTNAAAYFGGIDSHEWWLKAGSPAIDAGDPEDYPETDITGATRPCGGLPDAGPNERCP